MISLFLTSKVAAKCFSKESEQKQSPSGICILSPDVSVIYCSVTNGPKFSCVNNNNCFTQKFHLGQESVEANYIVSQGVT